MNGNHSSLCILNCITGERSRFDGGTFVIGAGPHSDLKMNSPQCPQVLCKVTKTGDAMEFQFSCPVLVNGAETTFFSAMLSCWQPSSSPVRTATAQ